MGNRILTVNLPYYAYQNTKFSDCWGFTGGITFYHQDGRCYWNNKPSPTFPGSAAQLQQLYVHRRALGAWKGLDNDVKEVWRSLAVDVHAHRPPFLNENHISGYNIFVSAYHGFAVLGDERIPEPQPFTPFPDFFASFESVSSISEALRLNFKLSMYGTDAPERYRLLCKVQVTEVGKGNNPSKMRNHLAEHSRSKEDVEKLKDVKVEKREPLLSPVFVNEAPGFSPSWVDEVIDLLLLGIHPEQDRHRPARVGRYVVQAIHGLDHFADPGQSEG